MKTPLSPLQLLQEVADEETMAVAIVLLKKRLKLTPEKLCLLLLRIVNPDEVVLQGEEAQLRGVHHETLKAYKDEKSFPRLINGR